MQYSVVKRDSNINNEMNSSFKAVPFYQHGGLYQTMLVMQKLSIHGGKRAFEVE